MARPRIGITVDTSDSTTRPAYESPTAYATAVEKAGGLPLLLPYKLDAERIPELVDLFDGFLLSGGNDLDPAVYGQAFHPKAEPIDPDRQRFEMALLAEVERRRRPVLGICLGSQLMNVYRGGSLIQFLPDVSRDPMLEHRNQNTNRRHAVRVAPETLLARAIGRLDVDANTAHKQSVLQPGRGLRVVATAPDGVVEAVEDPTFPLFLGVQWHPERLADEPDHLALFKLLVDRAGAAQAAPRRS